MYVLVSSRSVVKKLFSLEGAILHTISQQLLHILQIYFVKIITRTIGLFLRIQSLHKHTDEIPYTQLLYITQSHAWKFKYKYLST
jgi:hypothetical protein